MDLSNIFTSPTVLIDRLVLNINDICVGHSSSQDYEACCNSLLSLQDLRKIGSSRDGCHNYYSVPPPWSHNGHCLDGLKGQSGQRGQKSKIIYRYKPESSEYNLSVQLALNMSEMLRSELKMTDDFQSTGDIRGLDGKRNFIPTSVVNALTPEYLHQLQLKLLHEFLSNLVTSLNAVITSVHGENHQPDHSPDYFIQVIEVYRDIPISHAIQAVKGLRPECEKHFNRVEDAEYPTSHNNVALDCNCPCITVRPYTHQKHKFYAKTNELLRIETELTAKGLRRPHLLGSNRLPDITISSLDEFLSPIVKETQLKLSALLEPIGTPVRNYDGTEILLLLHAISRKCKKSEVFTELISILSQNGRISSKGFSDPSVLSRLQADGILNKTGRGLYSLSESNSKLLVERLGVLTNMNIGGDQHVSHSS